MSFDEFWQRYPRKEAKKAARKAWTKAVKVAPVYEIMAGLDRYIEKKPAWKDWMHPATFLNGERWSDEYERAPEPKPSPTERGSTVYVQGKGFIPLKDWLH